MSTLPTGAKQKFSTYFLSVVFPLFDELKFVMMLAVAAMLCVVNSHFRHASFVQLQDGRSFFVIAIVVIILLIIATKEKLPDDLKAWSSVLYYGFFALIAGTALNQRNDQLHGNTLFAHINLYLVSMLLIIAIARGVIALLVVRDVRLNKLTSRSFDDTQYTPLGFLVGVSASVFLTVFLHQRTLLNHWVSCVNTVTPFIRSTR